MDSLSRPFPSTKLSNVPPYDAVFSPHRPNFTGPSPIDYQEIFTTSQSSSIPVLDLSTFRDSSHSLSLDFHRSNPDYSKIFGGFSDEVVAVSYEQLFGCDKGRVPISQDSNNLSHQSPDALKQFNMSYNRISQKSKDVTQSPAVTGFTRFIDETVMEVEKPKQSAVNVSVDFPGKNSSVRKENNPVESVSEDKKSRNDQKRSINSESCKADFGDEIDVNSAALKKAIEKAQESIRIAKESVGRKKKGLESFSSKKIKNRLKVEGGMEDVTTSSFMDNEKLFDAKKFINEIHEKITESVKDSKFGVYNAAEVSSKTGKDECATLCSEYEAGIELRKSTIDSLEQQSVVKELESEENNDEVRLSNAHELVKELNVSPKWKDFNQNDNELLENEKQEHEDSEKHEEFEERENESEQDQNSEIHKDKETCDNKLEESEANPHNDCEIKQEDNPAVEIKVESLEESHEQEFDEKSSGDDNVMEETDDIDCVDDASNIVEINDINVETIHDVDDAIDQTASDDNEDCEVNSEENNIIENLADLGLENDVQSENNNIREDGNIQPPRMEVPDTKSTNEVKDSESRQKEDEIEEPGPSKVSGKDRFIRIAEEAAAKEREWERNRLAVDRAIREARERAFAEARERAERERAAVEKATEEVRQRMMAEAHEKVSRASKPSSEKTRVRAERAAVERATSEARQRALEKAISQKTASDLNRSESALRTKAKLEKHNRIMERAAKALAEKEKRDRLAQKEQAERNRLAENLDADIKRWSNGKEGNLRALLSTLQYILGPESGWQPVSLTEIITNSAVKKAYRKATLCVHPDKLQQRGATIQHKYICEKVFDLLKAAWSRFNSAER